MKQTKPETINTTAQISGLVDWLIFRHAPPAPYSPTMYIDLEGVNLCRDGSISILTLLIDTDTPTTRVYLIDVHTLGAQAFNTAGMKHNKTLKDILEDAEIPKVFFDVRNDSDALFAHFGVALQGIEDVQLMESATRNTTASRKSLNGLAKCIETNILVSFGSRGRDGWKLAKQKGERLFKAEYGGSYGVFNQRPIPEDVVSYCVGDVQYLPELRNTFWTWRSRIWQELVCEETKKRVAASQTADYRPYGQDRSLAPWSKEQNVKLDQWNYVPPATNYDDDEDDEWYDDGRTSCRDIIWDHDSYYSD